MMYLAKALARLPVCEAKYEVLLASDELKWRNKVVFEHLNRLVGGQHHELPLGGEGGLEGTGRPLVHPRAVAEGELEHREGVVLGHEDQGLGADLDPARDLIVDGGEPVLGLEVVDYLQGGTIEECRVGLSDTLKSSK